MRRFLLAAAVMAATALPVAAQNSNAGAAAPPPGLTQQWLDLERRKVELAERKEKRELEDRCAEQSAWGITPTPECRQFEPQTTGGQPPRFQPGMQPSGKTGPPPQVANARWYLMTPNACHPIEDIFGDRVHTPEELVAVLNQAGPAVAIAPVPNPAIRIIESVNGDKGVSWFTSKESVCDAVTHKPPTP